MILKVSEPELKTFEQRREKGEKGESILDSITDKLGDVKDKVVDTTKDVAGKAKDKID